MLISYYKGKPVVHGLFMSVEEREKAQARVEAEHAAMSKPSTAQAVKLKAPGVQPKFGISR